MAKIFVALNNFCRIKEDYCAMPPFYESFLQGLKNAGNTVKCFQTKTVAGGNRFANDIPDYHKEFLKEFNPDLCILFNNNFWDISDLVDCPILVYDVDSPLEWQSKESLIENVGRYHFVYNQIKGKEEILDYFRAEEQQCCYIPFFSEICPDPNVKPTNNVVFLGTNWSWRGYDFLNKFVRTVPSESDIKKAIEVLNQYIQEPLKPSHEIYYELQNCPHDRINLGNLFRCATEISGLRRLHFLEAISDLGLEINGYYWKIDMMNYFPEVLACVRDKQIWTKKQSEDYYNTAKIAFSTNHIQAQGGFSFRVCDIMASNACLVSEYSEDLKRIFPHLPLFATPQEAREQCKRLLENESLRQEIVVQSHETINRSFRFKHVLEKLESFTGLRLHGEGEGSLTIFPGSEEESQSWKSKMADRRMDYMEAKGSDFGNKSTRLKNESKRRFPTKYIRFCNIKLFKVFAVNNTRKEIYIGPIPLVSFDKSNGEGTIRFLFFEKIILAIRKGKSFVKKIFHVLKTWKFLSAKKRHLRFLKDKWERGDLIKICLFVSRINCWMFEDIYYLLKNSKRFDPVIVVKPFLSRGESYMKECMNSTYEGLLKRGFSPIKGYDEETGTYLDVRKEINPDIIFYTKFWKPHFHPNFYIDKFRDKMTLLIDYGYNITGHAEAMNFELQNSVDIYFYYSPIQKEISSRYMNNKAKNVVVSGAPKLDPIFSSHYIPKDPWKPQSKRKKRIIWAPHHEDKAPVNMYQLDAFYDLYEVMFEIADKYKEEVQFAFKPHPLLKVKLYEKWGETATNRYYEKWDNLKNGQLEDGEFIDLFLTSDAMILDCLSFIAEYTATGKPALFTIGSKSRVLLNELGKELYEYLYHAQDTLKRDICHFIEDVVIAGNDVKKEGRIEFINENLRSPNHKTAAENVYDNICSYIINGKI